MIIDLFRFGWKFEPFTNKDYLFPQTKITTFLQDQKQPLRVMSTDSRILPPNFSIMYKIQTLDGYDPLYLQRYGELMVAIKRDKPDINPPFGFNRIITPQNPSSKLISFLGVKYVLSLDEINQDNLQKVFTDGRVNVYENTKVFDRTFFVNSTILINDKQSAINFLLDPNSNLRLNAIVEINGEDNIAKNNWSIGKSNLLKYEDNNILIETENKGDGFLVLTDTYFPTWHAKIDGKETKIYLTDFNFRGIIVPSGKHLIKFYDSLF